MMNANSSNFEKVISESKDLVLVYLWASFCGPCRSFSPVIEEISNLYKDKLDVIKVNIEESGSIANKYNVITIPTIVLLNKNTVVAKRTGSANKKTIIEFLDKFIEV